MFSFENCSWFLKSLDFKAVHTIKRFSFKSIYDLQMFSFDNSSWIFKSSKKICAISKYPTYAVHFVNWHRCCWILTKPDTPPPEPRWPEGKEAVSPCRRRNLRLCSRASGGWRGRRPAGSFRLLEGKIAFNLPCPSRSTLTLVAAAWLTNRSVPAPNARSGFCIVHASPDWG
jgi:hypothetical protein